MGRVRIQRIDHSKPRQASRGRPAPKKLGELIELINSIPVEKELPSSTDLTVRFLDEGTWAAPGANAGIELVAVHKRVIDDLSDKVRDFIGPINTQTLNAAIERYSYLIDGRNILRAIAARSKNDLEIKIEHSHWLVHLQINDQGQITIQQPPLLEVLIEDGVDAKRIRQCEICNRIFWAGRLDQSCCGRRCSHIFRTRRWRKNYPEKYKIQRYDKAEKKERNLLSNQ